MTAHAESHRAGDQASERSTARTLLSSAMQERATIAAREAVARRLRRNARIDGVFANPNAVLAGKLDHTPLMEIATGAALIAMTEVL